MKFFLSILIILYCYALRGIECRSLLGVGGSSGFSGGPRFAKYPDESNKFWAPSYLFFHDVVKTFLLSKFGISTEVENLTTTEITPIDILQANELVELIPPKRVPSGQPLLSCNDLLPRTHILLDKFIYECVGSSIRSTEVQIRETCTDNEHSILICQENKQLYFPIYTGIFLMFKKDVLCNGKMFDSARNSLELVCQFIEDEAPIPVFSRTYITKKK